MCKVDVRREYEMFSCEEYNEKKLSKEEYERGKEEFGMRERRRYKGEEEV